jgi:hypothetical protein
VQSSEVTFTLAQSNLPTSEQRSYILWRMPRHVRRKGVVFHEQEGNRYYFGTHLCRLSRDSNRRASARVETAIGGHKSSCYENGWLPILSVTCCLSGCFDGSQHHVWSLDDRDVGHATPIWGNPMGAFGYPSSQLGNDTWAKAAGVERSPPPMEPWSTLETFPRHTN